MIYNLNENENCYQKFQISKQNYSYKLMEDEL